MVKESKDMKRQFKEVLELEKGNIKQKIKELKLEWDNLFKQIIENAKKRDYTVEGSKNIKEERRVLWDKRRSIEAMINDLELRLENK